MDIPYANRPEEWKQRHRDTNRRWKRRHRDKVREMKRRHYQRHKEELNRKVALRNERDNGRVKAHTLARHIPLDKGAVCEECGSSEQLEKHHPDYKKPLNVRIMCKSCHSKLSQG